MNITLTIIDPLTHDEHIFPLIFEYNGHIKSAIFDKLQLEAYNPNRHGKIYISKQPIPFEELLTYLQQVAHTIPELKLTETCIRNIMIHIFNELKALPQKQKAAHQQKQEAAPPQKQAAAPRQKKKPAPPQRHQQRSMLTIITRRAGDKCSVQRFNRITPQRLVYNGVMEERSLLALRKLILYTRYHEALEQLPNPDEQKALLEDVSTKLAASAAQKRKP